MVESTKKALAHGPAIMYMFACARKQGVGSNVRTHRQQTCTRAITGALFRAS